MYIYGTNIYENLAHKFTHLIEAASEARHFDTSPVDPSFLSERPGCTSTASWPTNQRDARPRVPLLQIDGRVNRKSLPTSKNVPESDWHD